MQRNLIFLRHGKVDLPYDSHDKMPFAILNELGLQKLDPPSDTAFLDDHKVYLKNLLKEFNFSSIFRSPSQRCATLETYIQSLLLEPITSITVLEELQEIRFDLKTLFTSENIAVKDIGQKLFESLLFGGPGVEKLGEVFRRIKTAIDEIPDSGNTLILTHGYLMKVIATTQGKFENGESLSMELLNATSRFGYLDGFKLSNGDPMERFSLDGVFSANRSSHLTRNT